MSCDFSFLFSVFKLVSIENKITLTYLKHCGLAQFIPEFLNGTHQVPSHTNSIAFFLFQVDGNGMLDAKVKDRQKFFYC
jgi:hypothetical protein